MNNYSNYSNQSNLIDEKKYIIKSENHKKIEIYLRNYNNEEFSIFINKTDEFNSNKYELKCRLEEFQKNRFFKIFINIDEIMRELENKIQNAKIIEETNILYLEIPIGLTVVNEIILEIKEIVQSPEEKIKELQDKIEKLNNKIKQKNKKIEELTKKNNELKNELYKSNILNPDEINLVINWIKNNNNFNNVSFKLLYSAKKNGDSASTFHKLCDEKGPTIIFVKNEDDLRYGGFTSISWKNDDENNSDSSSFLFSLTNKEKYLLKNKNDGNAVSSNKNRGPGFGNGSSDFFIPDKCFTNKSFRCFSCSFQFDNFKMYDGKKSFLIKDYEVFSVINK